MKHPYTVGCQCNRCEKEKMRRNSQSKANQRPANQCSRQARQVYASRGEQHARLLDCGYLNWDDRG